MSKNLLDRAYDLHKQGTAAHRAASIAQLEAEFLGTALAQIDDAFDQAGKLISAACAWADQFRGPANDGTGTPTIDLSQRCPGFSEGTYSDAEAWALYLTK